MSKRELVLTRKDIEKAEEINDLHIDDIRYRLKNRRTKGWRNLGRWQYVPSFEIDDFILYLNEFDWKCIYCGIQTRIHEGGKQPEDTSFTVDHIKPLDNGGTNLLTNIVCSCYRCNVSKKSLILDEFLTLQGISHLEFTRRLMAIRYRHSIERSRRYTS